jgi:hypothetical protein
MGYTTKLFEIDEVGKRIREISPSAKPELIAVALICDCGAEIEQFFDGVECDPTFPHRRPCANGHQHTLYFD